MLFGLLRVACRLEFRSCCQILGCLVPLIRSSQRNAQVEIAFEDLGIYLNGFAICGYRFAVVVKGLLVVSKVIPRLIAFWILDSGLLKNRLGAGIVMVRKKGFSLIEQGRGSRTFGCWRGMVAYCSPGLLRLSPEGTHTAEQNSEQTPIAAQRHHWSLNS